MSVGRWALWAASLGLSGMASPVPRAQRAGLMEEEGPVGLGGCASCSGSQPCSELGLQPVRLPEPPSGRRLSSRTPEAAGPSVTRTPSTRGTPGLIQSHPVAPRGFYGSLVLGLQNQNSPRGS